MNTPRTTSMSANRIFAIALVTLTVSYAVQAAFAQEFQSNPKQLKDVYSGEYTGKTYSPYAQRNFANRPLWGETHVHTALSMDAGGFGNRLGVREAYRFAQGQEVTASSGQKVRLSRPLDWLVVADHSDGLGFITDILAASPLVTKYKQGKRWSEGFNAGGQKAVEATLDLIQTFSQGKMNPEMIADYSPGSEHYKTIWDDVIDAAEEYNQPGRFTALIGFEWTSLVKGGNMHRNVIFRDGRDRVGQVVPYTTQAPIGSTDPLDLFKYLENYEATTGGSAQTLAHNGNLSNGIMFPSRCSIHGPET